MCMDFKKHPKPGKCHVRYCSNDSRLRKNGKSAKMCYKCESRRRKEVDPAAYFFYKLQQNAKHRRIPFSLTLDEFRKFCDETNYLLTKGTGGDHATIDRKLVYEGYHYDNLQVLTKRENSRKQYVEYHQEDFSVPF